MQINWLLIERDSHYLVSVYISGKGGRHPDAKKLAAALEDITITVVRGVNPLMQARLETLRQ